MRHILNALRSILFNLSFYLFTIIFCTFFVLPFVFARTDGPVRKGVGYYCAGSLWLARVIMGIRYEFRNTERLPRDGALILAAAHQSYMDPMLLYQLRQDVTALAKKELFYIPMIGPLLKKMGVIKIDRQAGKAHHGMEDVVKQVRERDLLLIVYPQATRVPIGMRKKLKPGAYFMQKFGDMDVYPVATNTGIFWTKGFWHRPGTAVFEIGEPLTTRPERREFMEYIEEQVIENSNELVREAGYGELLKGMDKTE